ncbi:MaoC/PaaZ C-terminal domain-containing protein [Duganella callida]|uniref:MaoC-like domain-containing protein n=1 Tax=Duganella callida TaxID=2561932 RepID=A0A4Y9RV71_9BURK|nr:MaoC/PaaZ C-terminal domain-containing protein [Duganella callida]TFW13197.1 hypothetical protein E4L98_29435 [Duganella callida]
MEMIENRPFGQLRLGDSASLVRTLSARDIALFAIVSGDVNPAHVDPQYARQDVFHHVVAHGMWGGALISAVLGTQLPGPGTIYLQQSLRFLHPIAVGDTVTVRLTVQALEPATRRVTLDCQVLNQAQQLVIAGTALVLAPAEKIVLPRMPLPDIALVGTQPPDTRTVI